MNADGRRWICHSLAFALFCVGPSALVQSEEFQSQLAAEIERRFEDTSLEVDVAPLKFGCQFSEYVASWAPVYIAKFSAGWLIVPPSHGSPSLETAASLPQPTLVEAKIAKGFPSGEPAKPHEAHDDGYSYLLAEEEFSFGGVKFSR
jgi:hypothetical protein